MKKAMSAKHKAQSRRASPEESTPRLWIVHLCKGLLITLATGLGLLLCFSLVANFYPDPDFLILPLALIGAGITALVGGISTVRIHGHSALICGLFSGGLLIGLMMLLSLFFTKDGIGYSGGVSCLLHAGIPLLSVIGGYLGLQKGKSKKHRK